MSVLWICKGTAKIIFSQAVLKSMCTGLVGLQFGANTVRKWVPGCAVSCEKLQCPSLADGGGRVRALTRCTTRGTLSMVSSDYGSGFPGAAGAADYSADSDLLRYRG